MRHPCTCTASCGCVGEVVPDLPECPASQRPEVKLASILTDKMQIGALFFAANGLFSRQGKVLL